MSRGQNLQPQYLVTKWMVRKPFKNPKKALIRVKHKIKLENKKNQI